MKYRCFNDYTNKMIISNSPGLIKHVLLILMSFSLTNINAQQTQQDYNVLFIMLDQLSINAVSAYGNSIVNTPNIDRIASEGVTFSNSVCVVPFCSPSRASIITGLYPNNHKIIGNVVEGRDNGLSPSIPTTEGILFEDGYVTKHFGLWHLGNLQKRPCYKDSEDLTYTSDFNSKVREFYDSLNPVPGSPRADEVWVNNGDGWGFFQKKYMAEKYQQAIKDKMEGHTNLIKAIGRSGTPFKYQRWNMLADECISWIKANKESKFMVTYSASPPHEPYQGIEPYYSSIDTSKIQLPETYYEASNTNAEWGGFGAVNFRLGKYFGEQCMKERMHCYYSMVLMMDDVIGKILKCLDDEGLTQNTLLVFTSDHGDMMGAHGMFDKVYDGFYEEVLCTPLMMRLPGVIKPGVKVKASVNSIDIGPTILDFLGKSLPGANGKSMKKFVRGEIEDVTGTSFSMRPNARCVRGEINGNLYKYSKAFNISMKSYYEELYCLNEDPKETVNQISNPKYSAIVKELKARYDSYAKEYGANLIEDIQLKGPYTWGNTKK